ncbi:MAG: extracellular solute-binding protein [Candidatus Sumerlaeaceae bacterium]
MVFRLPFGSTARAARVLALALAWLCSMAVRAEQITLEAAAFKGGYGIDFYEKCAREFEKIHPNVKINLWGSPRVWDQLTPRFAAGMAPDIIYPGWGTNVWALIFEGQLLKLDKYLAAPALNSQKPWHDTFLKSFLDTGSHRGSYYTLPYEFGTFGWWYNKKLFRKHGWAVPRTYDELLSVSALIRKEHIAPVTFTGRYPQYMLDGFIWPWVHSEGGEQALKRIDELTTGCWQQPAVLKATRTFLQMKNRGYFQQGAIGMTHIESQMEWLVGRAAMIPNGTWLYTEMKKMLPPGFEMEFMLCPVFAEGKGDPSAVTVSYDGKGWCVSSTCKHPDEAVEYLRYITSAEKAREFMVQKGTLVAIRDVGEEYVPGHLKEVQRTIKAAKTSYSIHYADWYPELGTAVQNALRDLYNDLLTPEQFSQRLEKTWAATRNDPNRKKFGRE